MGKLRQSALVHYFLVGVALSSAQGIVPGRVSEALQNAKEQLQTQSTINPAYQGQGQLFFNGALGQSHIRVYSSPNSFQSQSQSQSPQLQLLGPDSGVKVVSKGAPQFTLTEKPGRQFTTSDGGIFRRVTYLSSVATLTDGKGSSFGPSVNAGPQQNLNSKPISPRPTASSVFQFPTTPQQLQQNQQQQQLQQNFYQLQQFQQQQQQPVSRLQGTGGSQLPGQQVQLQYQGQPVQQSAQQQQQLQLQSPFSQSYRQYYSSNTNQNQQPFQFQFQQPQAQQQGVRQSQPQQQFQTNQPTQLNFPVHRFSVSVQVPQGQGQFAQNQPQQSLPQYPGDGQQGSRLGQQLSSRATVAPASPAIYQQQQPQQQQPQSLQQQQNFQYFSLQPGQGQGQGSHLIPSIRPQQYAQPSPVPQPQRQSAPAQIPQQQPQPVQLQRAPTPQPQPQQFQPAPVPQQPQPIPIQHAPTRQPQPQPLPALVRPRPAQPQLHPLQPAPSHQPQPIQVRPAPTPLPPQPRPLLPVFTGIPEAQVTNTLQLQEPLNPPVVQAPLYHHQPIAGPTGSFQLDPALYSQIEQPQQHHPGQPQHFPEPENGFNPNFLQPFPEPPYESEFQGEPELGDQDRRELEEYVSKLGGNRLKRRRKRRKQRTEFEFQQ